MHVLSLALERIGVVIAVIIAICAALAIMYFYWRILIWAGLVAVVAGMFCWAFSTVPPVYEYLISLGGTAVLYGVIGGAVTMDGFYDMGLRDFIQPWKRSTR